MATALKQIAESKVKIAAAIVDIGLPEGKGDKLAADIRGMRQEMLVIIATGYADGEVRARALP